MLSMITEEPESGVSQNDAKDATDSLSGMVRMKEENLTFPRRSHCPRASARKIDWVAVLAKATEEDKKANYDITYPQDEDSESENMEPSSLSGPVNDEILDLSAVAKGQQRGYTMPAFERRYLPTRPTPLKELSNEMVTNNRGFCVQPAAGREAVAKKALFGDFYYEREVVSHKRVTLTEAKKEECHQYGHSVSNGYYSQTPEFRASEPHQTEHQENV